MQGTIGTHGGYRHGTRNKTAGQDAAGSLSERFDNAKLRVEEAKAETAELDLAVKRGALLPREDIKAAAAVIVAAFVQAARSIPDNLERELGLPPDVVERVAMSIDDALAELGRQIEALA